MTRAGIVLATLVYSLLAHWTRSLWKCNEPQILWPINQNCIQYDSQAQQDKFRKCFLPFWSEWSCFLIYKRENWNTQIHNFHCSFDRVWKLIPHSKRKKQYEGVRERWRRGVHVIQRGRNRRPGENYVMRIFTVCTAHQNAIRFI